MTAQGQARCRYLAITVKPAATVGYGITTDQCIQVCRSSNENRIINLQLMYSSLRSMNTIALSMASATARQVMICKLLLPSNAKDFINFPVDYQPSRLFSVGIACASVGAWLKHESLLAGRRCLFTTGIFWLLLLKRRKRAAMKRWSSNNAPFNQRHRSSCSDRLCQRQYDRFVPVEGAL